MRALVVAALLACACGGAQRPAAGQASGPPAAVEAPRRSCEDTCAIVTPCGGPCECDGSALFVCLSSADSCAEVEECRAP